MVNKKRQWTDTPDYEPREWQTTKHFDDSWLDAIRRAQPNVPVEEVEKAKTWFEYLPKIPPYLSTYRCWLCNKWVDFFQVRKQHKLALSSDEGILHISREDNKAAPAI